MSDIGISVGTEYDEGLKRVANDVATLGESGDQLDNVKKSLLDLTELGKSAHVAFNEFTLGLGVNTAALESPMQLIGQAARFAIDTAMEAQLVQAQTEAVIAGTQAAAGMTKDEVEALAGQLSRLSGVDDEVVQSGENLLLTFRNIGEDTFPRATTAMLDMSVALAKGDMKAVDLKGNALLLGKALNDPEKGLTALTRAGVSFTEQQKDQIKAMAAAGDMAGAQAIILQELEQEFGGAAKAAGDTAQGGVEKFKNALENVAQAAGEKALPAITDLTTGMAELLTASERTNDELIAMANSTNFWEMVAARTELRFNGWNRAAELFIGHQQDMREKLIDGKITLEEYNDEIERSAKVAGLWNETRTVSGTTLDFVDARVQQLTEDQVEQERAIASATKMADDHDQVLQRVAVTTDKVGVEYETLQARIDATTTILGPAELGMQALADSTRAGSDASNEYARWLKEEAKAHEENVKATVAGMSSQLDFVASLKDMSALELAKDSIGRLKDAMKADPDRAAIYAEQIRNLQRSFGIITPQSEAAAAMFDRLTTAQIAGYLSAQDVATALKNLPAASKDGVVAVEELGISAGGMASLLSESAAKAGQQQSNMLNTTKKTKIDLMDEMGNALADQQTELQGRISSSMQSVSNSMTTARNLANTVADEIKSAWDKVPREVVTNYRVTRMNEVPGDLPMRAAGGDVMAGWPYWVGEEGPEPYVPAQNGRILSRTDAMSALRGGGGDTSQIAGALNAMAAAIQGLQRGGDLYLTTGPVLDERTVDELAERVLRAWQSRQ